MNDILREIVATTRAAVRERQAASHVKREHPGRFAAALRQRGPAIIAEIKAASPSAGTIVENPNVEEIARSYARGGAAAISVVTEPRFFRGSIDWVRRAAAASGLPVVMKDFVVDPIQLHEAAAAGADAILLIAAILTPDELRDLHRAARNLGLDVLVEVHDEVELQAALNAEASIIGVNSRDLRDFNVDLSTAERLGPKIPEHVIRVAESGIHRRADVTRLRAAGFQAFLVGESLLKQKDRTAAVRKLVSPEVKICGVRTAEIAQLAVAEGASFVGLVFAPGSPRTVNAAQARGVADAVRGKASVVGVFRDQQSSEIARIAEEIGLDLIQLHGSETPGQVSEMPRPVIKALPVNSVMPDPAPFAQAEWILFDASSPGAGQRFDWKVLESWDRSRKFFLAGGLTPENIAEAIERVRPDAIDISSGVESAPGEKSPERIRQLFHAVRGSL